MTQHAMQRRAQLVAHGREELRLRAIRRLRRVLQLAQLVLRAQPLADIAERHDRTFDDAATDDRIGRVFARKRAAVAPPQHLALSPARLPGLERAKDRTI